MNHEGTKGLPYQLGIRKSDGTVRVYEFSDEPGIQNALLVANQMNLQVEFGRYSPELELETYSAEDMARLEEEAKNV